MTSNNPGEENGIEFSTPERTTLRSFSDVSFQAGDFIYYSGTAFQRLGVGAMNQEIGVSSSLPIWIGAAYSQQILTGINLKTTGATKIFTTPNNGLRFYPDKVTFEITAATAITVAGAASVGTNASTYNNILSISTLTGAAAVNNILSFALDLVVTNSVAPNTDIYVNITLGITATSATGSVTILGHYR